MIMQPAMAPRLFGDAMLSGIGLLARVLLVGPESRMWREPPPGADADVQDYTARLRTCLARQPRTCAGSVDVLDPVSLPLHPDAGWGCDPEGGRFLPGRYIGLHRTRSCVVKPYRVIMSCLEASAKMLQLILNEINHDAFYQQNFANDGERFVAWYLRRVLLRDAIQTRDDITDGQHDKQMDAVIIDDEDRRILIIQGKFATSSQVDAQPLHEVLAAWVRLQDLPSLQQDCNERLKLKLEAVRKALEDEYRVEFELLTTGTLTEAAKTDLKAFADRLEDLDEMSGSLQLVDAEVLETRLAEAEAQELPSLNHVIKVDPTQTLLTEIGAAKTILTVVALTECLRLPGITDGRLFRKNVRQALGATNRVNKALRATINGERVREFFYYHNGITAICNAAEYDFRKGTISVNGLSVVNGCQSLSTIYSASERVRSSEAKDAKVLLRV